MGNLKFHSANSSAGKDYNNYGLRDSANKVTVPLHA